MLGKTISDYKEKNQQYEDNLYKQLQNLFQDDFSSDQAHKTTKPDFNLYYKNKILPLVETESTNHYKNIAKSNYPFEILFQRTALIDAVIRFSLECATLQFNITNKTSLKPENVPFAIVARGGYGRSEMFPLSDIDLTVISNHQSHADKTVKGIVRNFEYLFIHQNIFPSSSSFGYLTLDEISMPSTGKEIINFRSLLEGRFVSGSKETFNLFQKKIFSILESNKQFFIEDNIMYTECYAVENTVFQQEPDVKNDIRRFYWALFLTKIKYGYKEPSMSETLNKLFSEKRISEQVYNRDQIALNFLVKVRLLLHLIQPSGNKDKLSFENREKIAKTLGFKLNDFYKEYFYHAALPLKRDGRNLLWDCIWRDETVAKNLNAYFGTNDKNYIVFIPGKEKIFSDSPEKIFDLMKFVAQEGFNMSYPIILSIEENKDNLVPIFMESETKGKMIETFQHILMGKYFAKAIRDMNEFGLIGNFIIPKFSALCGLPQDIYVHRFPVDIHIMAALDAINMLELNQGDPFLVQLYQNLKNNIVLKLATLLHDIGKGYKTRHQNEDEVGEAMTPAILKELGIMDQSSIDSVSFLVGKHLAMKDLLDLDPYDNETYEMIWKLIDGDMEKLRMLILLTFADRYGTKMKMTSGQITSLKHIYHKALYYEKKEAVDESLKVEFINLIDLPPDLQAQLDTYSAYKQSKNHFAVQLYYVENKPADLILCLPDQEGILYRIACIIAFNKISVISAQVNTWNNVALDIFKMVDVNDKPVDYTNFYYVQRCVKEDIDKVFVKGNSVTNIYKNRVLVGANTKKMYKKISPKVRVIGRAVKIVTPDILGVFMQTTKTFASMNMPIFRAIVHCRNNYATNVFYLGRKDIRKLNSNMESFIRRLSEELNKLIVPGAIF